MFEDLVLLVYLYQAGATSTHISVLAVMQLQAKPCLTLRGQKLNINNKKTIKFMATTAKLLEDSLLVIWNDRNVERRLDAMEKIYSPDIHFYESNTGDAIIGHQAINELISKLQTEWPVEFQFELNKPSQVNQTTQIISWNLGPKGGVPIATGMDVAITENDLIKSLYLFLDTE